MSDLEERFSRIIFAVDDLCEQGGLVNIDLREDGARIWGVRELGGEAPTLTTIVDTALVGAAATISVLPDGAYGRVRSGVRVRALRWAVSYERDRVERIDALVGRLRFMCRMEGAVCRVQRYTPCS